MTAHLLRLPAGQVARLVQRWELTVARPPQQSASPKFKRKFIKDPRMCIYVYVCNIHIRIHTHIHMYIYIYTHMYVYIYIYMYLEGLLRSFHVDVGMYKICCRAARTCSCSVPWSPWPNCKHLTILKSWSVLKPRAKDPLIRENIP